MFGCVVGWPSNQGVHSVAGMGQGFLQRLADHPAGPSNENSASGVAGVETVQH